MIILGLFICFTASLWYYCYHLHQSHSSLTGCEHIDFFDHSNWISSMINNREWAQWHYTSTVCINFIESWNFVATASRYHWWLVIFHLISCLVACKWHMPFFLQASTPWTATACEQDPLVFKIFYQQSHCITIPSTESMTLLMLLKQIIGSHPTTNSKWVTPLFSHQNLIIFIQLPTASRCLFPPMSHYLSSHGQ